MKRTLCRLFRAITLLRKVNIFKTIIFNLKFLPLKQAIHIPILLMGPVKICESKGSITLDSCNTGTVRIGGLNNRLFGFEALHKSVIRIDGGLILGHHVSINNGFAIAVEQGVSLLIGNDVEIGPLSKIYCENSISIGNNAHMSWEVQIFDTDFHYMTDNGTIRRCNAPIEIGDNVWIGNRVTINKGSKIPSWAIVASNSLVNKDYSQYAGGILAGCPAKYIASSKKRIFSYSEEKRLNEYFLEHSDAKEFNAGV